MAGEKQITGAQQENLLTLLAHDDKHGKLVAQINPDLFEGEYREVADRLIKFWKKHKRAPKAHTADLFGDILDDKTDRRRKTYERILRGIDQLIQGINTEYVMTTMRNFTRLQTMKDSILKAAEQLNEADDTSIQTVEAMLSDLLKARTFDFDPGITLMDVDRIVDYLQMHYSEFRMGITMLDKLNIVPSRGATFLILAPPGRGKTWGMVHIGKHALLQRKKVVHFTLEMAGEETGQRYYQSLFSLSKRKEAFEIPRLGTSRGMLRSIGKRIEVMPDFAFSDPEIRKKLRTELAPWARRIPNLIIKRFPPRSVTVDDIRVFLDGLEASTGFIPDMIILDYVGILKTDAKNHRISLGRQFEDFRALCVERAMAGVTASQVSKTGATSNHVRATHTAEDFSLIATTDVAVTYSQTETERRLGLARLFIDKARGERDKFELIITQAYDIGQFAIQSAPMDRVYLDYVKEEKTEWESEQEGKDDDAEG